MSNDIRSMEKGKHFLIERLYIARKPGKLNNLKVETENSYTISFWESNASEN